MAETKEKLLRVLQILQKTDEKSPLNAGQIIEKLDSEYGLSGVDRHSIYQDVLVLENCGYAIKQSKDKRKGWYLAKHFFEDWELGILMDSVMQTKCITFEEAKSLRKRLLDTCSDRGKKRFRNLFSALPGVKAEEGQQMGAYIESMLEAMYTGKKIEFQYTELDEFMKPQLRKSGAYYSLNLYGIYWGGMTYYLVGMHDHHEDLTHYRLDRIRDLKISEEKAVPAEERLGKDAKTIIQKMIDRAVNHYSGEEICVVLEYYPGQAENAILYDFTGGKMHTQKMKDGRMRASFWKMNSVTLSGWLMQYASMYEVIEPVELRSEIIEELQKGIKAYYKKQGFQQEEKQNEKN